MAANSLALIASTSSQAAVRSAPKTGKKGRKKRKGGAGGSKAGHRESGVDVLGVATVTPKSQVGQRLLVFPIDPQALANTRIAVESKLWARWRPNSLTIEVISGAGYMTTGSYIVAWNADPSWSFRLLNGGNTVAALTALGVQSQKHIGDNVRLSIPCDPSRRWYMFDGPDEDRCHGVVVAALAGAISATSLSVTFKLHWSISFEGMTLPQQVADLYVEPEYDYVPIFTDSVSDFAGGTRLTFKHAAGGSVVPWPRVVEGVVYEPDLGTTIPYYTSATSTSEVKYLSKMLGQANYSTAIVCHASQADAEAYQKNGVGNVEKVLTWYKAGEWVTPDFPRLRVNAYVHSQVALVDLTRKEPRPAVRAICQETSASTSATESSLGDAVSALEARLMEKFNVLAIGLQRSVDALQAKLNEMLSSST